MSDGIHAGLPIILNTHKIPDQQAAAYQPTTMVDKRRAMMQTYADYALNTGAVRDNVTQISA